jgi:transposase InsO family protein
MAELAGSIQGQMIISINDHPDVRRVWSGDITYIWTDEGWLYLEHERSHVNELGK